MISKRWPLFFFLICATWFCGCGRPGNELGRLPVSGTVTFDGKPLDRGSIDFTPTGEGTQSGATIENGTYEISEKRGLPPGEYIVRISSPEGGAEASGAPGESSDLPEERIPANFNVESDQKVVVEAGEDNVFNFTIPKAN